MTILSASIVRQTEGMTYAEVLKAAHQQLEEKGQPVAIELAGLPAIGVRLSVGHLLQLYPNPQTPADEVANRDRQRVHLALLLAMRLEITVQVYCSNHPEMHADISPTMSASQAWRHYNDVLHGCDFGD